MTIYTIGHSTRSTDEFLALLGANGIRRLVDVRRYPGSRRLPHFASAALRAALSAGGIDYVHEPDLGGRRSPRPDSPNSAWRSPGFRGYADHMATNAFRQALDGVIAAAAGEATVLMCAEAVPWRCHRQLIADALVARGIEVHHILGAGARPRHELHSAARVGADLSVTYPGASDPQIELI